MIDLLLASEIEVLHAKYNIFHVQGLGEEYDTDGFCEFEEPAIYIDLDLPKERKLRVILHEITHAYAFESGLHEFLDDQSLEMFCQTLSGFLLSLYSLAHPS
jgi:Zn-dependent peptidase ImmA (M78 family)